MDALGPFEQLVLAAVMALGRNAYGVTIYARVIELAGRDVNMGSVYVTLDRLEDKGFLSSRAGDPTAERRGKPKRFYKIETPGLSALRESVETSRRISEAFESSWRLGKWKPGRVR